MVSVPVVLVGLYLLPESLRRDLVLSYADPTAVTAFAAHFVHLDATFLASNLLLYALVVPMAYLLCLHAGRRREFYVVFATFLLAFPFLLSALNVALPRPRIGYGFSGINTAFFGFLPIALVWYLSRRPGTRTGLHDAPVLFFGCTTLVAVVAVPPSLLSLSVVVSGLLATVAYLGEWMPGIVTLRRELADGWRTRPGALGIAAVGASTAVLFPFVAFPAAPAGGGQVVNIYVHLLGYTLGFIAAYVTFVLVERHHSRAGVARPAGRLID